MITAPVVLAEDIKQNCW